MINFEELERKAKNQVLSDEEQEKVRDFYDDLSETSKKAFRIKYPALFFEFRESKIGYVIFLEGVKNQINERAKSLSLDIHAEVVKKEMGDGTGHFLKLEANRGRLYPTNVLEEYLEDERSCQADLTEMTADKLLRHFGMIL